MSSRSVYCGRRTLGTVHLHLTAVITTCLLRAQNARYGASHSWPTHRTIGTTIRTFFVHVHGTPLSICSHVVMSLYSSFTGEPRFQCKSRKETCDSGALDRRAGEEYKHSSMRNARGTTARRSLYVHCCGRRRSSSSRQASKMGVASAVPRSPTPLPPSSPPCTRAPTHHAVHHEEGRPLQLRIQAKGRGEDEQVPREGQQDGVQDPQVAAVHPVHVQINVRLLAAQRRIGARAGQRHLTQQQKTGFSLGPY